MNLDFFPYKLIGNFYGSTVKFVTPIEEENYYRGLKNLDETWPYHTLDFNYKFNTHGHRSIELEELPENYFLITGCSHTLGVGLRLEDTYPFKLSELLQCQYYNLAMNGSGPDLTFFNTLIFLSKVKFKPKFVLIQWPDPARQFFIGNDTSYFFSPGFSNSSDDVPKAYKILITQNNTILQNIFYRNILANLLVSQDIPVFEFLFSGWLREDKVLYPEFDMNVKTGIIPIYETPLLDTARDLHHYGIKCNQSWANTIYNFIK